MNVVIAGGGTVGMQLAAQLTREGSNVTVIEKDPEQARLVSNRLDCLVVTGGGNNLENLRAARTDEADYFLAVTTSDEVNMIACGMVSSEFPDVTKIARVRNIDYDLTGVSGKSFLGIDYAINPQVAAAAELITSLEYGVTGDVMLFEKSNLQMRTIAVPVDSRFIGVTLQEIMLRLDVPMLVAVIVRGDTYLVPDGETQIKEGDILYAVATSEDFEHIFPRLGKPFTRLKNVVLVGGGEVGQMVAAHVTGEDQSGDGLRRFFSRRAADHRRVHIVERDYEKCKELATRFPSAVVINADISDEGLFHEQRLGTADLLIATTDNQELNMVTALYAKRLGVPRSMVLVKNASYANIGAQLRIDVSVSVKKAIVDTILTTIRKGRLRSVRSISNGEIEVVELTVGPGATVRGTALSELKLPQDTLVISVMRGGEVFVPNGRSVLNVNDDIVAVCREDALEQLEAMFNPVLNG